MTKSRWWKIECPWVANADKGMGGRVNGSISLADYAEARPDGRVDVKGLGVNATIATRPDAKCLVYIVVVIRSEVGDPAKFDFKVEIREANGKVLGFIDGGVTGNAAGKVNTFAFKFGKPIKKGEEYEFRLLVDGRELATWPLRII